MGAGTTGEREGAEARPEADGDVVESFRNGALRRFLEPSATYVLTRFLILRLLGLVYFVAFFSLERQLDPLLGAGGLLPARRFLDRVLAVTGSPGAAFARLPTLFWIDASDATLHAACWIGVALSIAVCAGVTNALVQLALWAIYMSFVHVGQVFYGYGWEIQLLETGLLAVFLCPVRRAGPFSSAPPAVVIWLFRWLVFRIMLGAGLIKLRGDLCWHDLTCLAYHYETQPIPNPLSWVLHAMPPVFHKLGVAFNHLVELVAPWFALGPRRGRHVAGVLIVVFQVVLILSGNLSFLNWLTIVPAIACFDDAALSRLLPERLRARALAAASAPAPSRPHRIGAGVFAAIVGLLSVQPIVNMASPGQSMNAAFDPLAIVNTYGAFGTVGRERNEVILQGTHDETPGEHTEWLEYELPCKPGDVYRRPCWVSPYHYRLDWQIWFAAMSTYDEEPWIVHLTYKLLRGDRTVAPLFARDPFPDRPPRWVRAELYRYEFTRPADGERAWWRRTRVREWMRPVSADDPELLAFLRAYGWVDVP